MAGLPNSLSPQGLTIECSSAEKTLPIPRHDSAARGSLSLSPEHPPNHQEDIHEAQSHSPAIRQMQSPRAMLSPTKHPYISQGHAYSAQTPVQTVQEALKGLVLQALRVLRDTAKEYRKLNLELGTIDCCWTAEIESVDAAQIDVSSNPALSELAPFKILNQILTESIIASGPMRVLIFRKQALDLLIYIQSYAEKYHLIQSPRVYVDIGRWMERLRQGNMMSKPNDLFSIPWKPRIDPYSIHALLCRLQFLRLNLSRAF